MKRTRKQRIGILTDLILEMVAERAPDDLVWDSTRLHEWATRLYSSAQDNESVKESIKQREADLHAAAKTARAAIMKASRRRHAGVRAAPFCP